MSVSSRVDVNQGTTKNGQGLPERQPLLSVVLFHPDYTVGFGIAPKSADLSGKPESARGLAPDIFRPPVITAGGELHPALRTLPPEPWRRRVFNTLFRKLHDRCIDKLYRFVWLVFD
jgi:hypothetical protein